jgi:hypothetical protein
VFLTNSNSAEGLKKMIKNWLAALVIGVFAIGLVGCNSDPGEVPVTEEPTEDDLDDMANIGEEDAGTPGGTDDGEEETE